MLYMITLALISFCGGMVALFALQIYLLQKYMLDDNVSNESISKISKESRFSLPSELKDVVNSENFKEETESWLSVNVILQFLFKEWKDTSVIRRYLLRKITVEFGEFLQNTTAGKFLENIVIRDLSLGSKCPVLKNVKVTNVVLHPLHGHIKEVDIQLDVMYDGGCEIIIQADTVLGKSAALAVKMTKLEGVGRLQLTQHPYSHWSFSFLQAPTTKFEVKSQLIPQITSLIVSQIRRILKKRHTLPRYKIRYKPFCLAPDMRHPPLTKGEDMEVEGNKLSRGYLAVEVIECSRLIETPANSLLYCTLAVDSCAWVELSSSQCSSWTTQDVEISRHLHQAVGILLKQEFLLDKYDYFVMVETIVPNSPASSSDIKRNDVLVSIGGIRVTTVTHAAKLFKHAGDKFVIRIERASHLRCSQSQDIFSKDTRINEEVISLKAEDCGGDGEEEEEEDGFVSYTLKESPELNRRNSSLHKQLLHKKYEDSLALSPKVRKKSEDHIKTDSNAPSTKNASKGRQTLDTISISSLQLDTESIGSDSDKSSERCYLGVDIDLKKTKMLKSSSDPIWEEKFEFNVSSKHRFLNIGIWYKRCDHRQDRLYYRNERDEMIGYASISLSDISLECALTKSGSSKQVYSFKPPEPKSMVHRDHKLIGHPGFNRKLCHGDITLAFTHTPDADDAEILESDDDGDVLLNQQADTDVVLSDIQLSSLDKLHDFIGANFHSSTICDFCHKKIWLKTAFQCRKCAMICHKKCVERCCHQTTCCPCVVDGPPPRNDSIKVVTTDLDSIETDIVLVGTPDKDSNNINVFESSMKNETSKNSRNLSSIFSTLKLHSKQSSLSQESLNASTSTATTTNSNMLAPPSTSDHLSISRSLPGSPNCTPIGSRKCSLQENPFETMQNDDDLDAAIDRVLRHHPQDERLVSSAKELGKELYVNMPIPQRKFKLNLMIAKLQAGISDEDRNRIELQKEEKQITDLTKKAKIVLLIKSCEEKMQALAVLMLHYYAGLQHCIDSDEDNSQNQQAEHEDSAVNKLLA